MDASYTDAYYSDDALPHHTSLIIIVAAPPLVPLPVKTSLDPLQFSAHCLVWAQTFSAVKQTLSDKFEVLQLILGLILG